MLNFSFFKTPFIFVALCFALGIYLEHLNANFLYFSTILFVLPIAFWFWNKKHTILVFSLLSFLFVGAFVQFSLNNRSSTLSRYQFRDVTVIVTVKEIAQESKAWRKSLCKVERLVVDERMIPLEENVLLYFFDDKIQLGDQLLLSTTLYEIENKGNPGEFDAKTYWNNKGIQFMGFVNEDLTTCIKYYHPSKFDLWKSKIISGIDEVLKEATNEDEFSYGVARALILGDKSELNPTVKESFQAAGAMHVLAVSGLHIGILITVLILVFRQFSRWISRTQATVFALIIVWGYAFLIDFPPSVVRASLMFSIIFFGKLMNARSNSLNSLAVAFVIMLAINPRWLFDVGFQLSFLAMIGIYTLYPLLSKLFFIKNKWVRKVWEGTAVGISAQIFTFPLTLYYFHQFPNYFILTNLGMMAFAFIVLLIGFGVISLKWVPGLRTVLGFLFAFSIGLMLQFVSFISNLPMAVATGFNLSGWIVIILYFLLIAFLLFKESKKMRMFILASFGVIFIIIQFDRFQQLKKEELVIFNQKYPLFSIKTGKNILAFCPERNIEKGIKVMDGYETLMGGEVLMITLDFEKVNLANQNFVQPMENGILIEYEKKRYFLRRKLMTDVPRNCFVVDLDRNMLRSTDYSLENGAFRVEK